MDIFEKAGKNMSDVQEINRSLVLRTIQQNNNSSRSEIAKKLGLRQTTVANIVNDLIESGIVLETNLLKSAHGRRAIGLALNQDLYRIVGIRLTRQHIRAGLFDITGKQHASSVVNIDPKNGVPMALKAMRDVIAEMLSKAGSAKVLGIGIGTPGPYIRDSGYIAVMADFPGWDSVSIYDELTKVFDLPIYIEYDAYAGALAEWWFSGHYNTDTVLLSVRMEQGLGAGVVQNGDLYCGAQGIAGNIGHISIDYEGLPCECGNFGCLRNYCTVKALVRDTVAELERTGEASILRELGALTVNDIIRAAKDGDALALGMLKRAARYLGYGLINTVYTYNPNLIVLSEEFSEAGDLFLGEIRTVFSERLKPVIADSIQIRFSNLKFDVVLVGATTLVINRIMENPSKYLGMV